MARRTRRPLWLKLLLAVLIVAPLGVAAWLYLDMREWRPEERAFPEQGVDLSGVDGAINFEVLKGNRADFVYTVTRDFVRFRPDAAADSCRRRTSAPL